jgi:hypothetical protein
LWDTAALPERHTMAPAPSAHNGIEAELSQKLGAIRDGTPVLR